MSIQTNANIAAGVAVLNKVTGRNAPSTDGGRGIESIVRSAPTEGRGDIRNLVREAADAPAGGLGNLLDLTA